MVVMARPPLLPLPDYQRIYQVAFSVLNASEIAITHRACLFFAAAGALLLREHYGLPATISAGCMALMLDEQKANVIVYGREEDGTFVSDDEAFHAWVQCDGWLLDFMAPIIGVALREDGRNWHVPRRMLQRLLSERKSSIGEIQKTGDLFSRHDAGLAELLIDRQPNQFADLLNVCQAWYRRPPKPLRDIAMADSHGPTKRLVAKAPAIEGAW